MHHLVRFLLLVSLTLLSGGARAIDVVVVLSERGPGYLEATEVMVAELGRAGLTVSDTDVRSANSLATALAQQTPRVIVTLGYESLRQVLEARPRVPVLAALIPRSGFERLLRDHASVRPAVAALYLDQPIGRQMDVIRLAFGAGHRVAVLLGPESSWQRSLLTASAGAQGFSLQLAEVGASQTVAHALADVLDGADVLLALPDTQVYNATTVGNVLMSSYRARVPVLAFSPAYVRAGATLSLHSTPVQVGQQVALMVRQHLQAGAVLTNQYPADFAITVNERVARSLDLDLNAAMLTEQLKRLARKP
ncbi:MAG TPA: ABC transporter substrate binding protein [Rhodoferax sp.]|nr:ABC transporter substrate binding protein [Rhodoferax sp.]